MEKNIRSTLIAKRGYQRNISGDAFSLYLSNSPIAAQWLAERIGDKEKVLLELCCGIGATLERVAPAFKYAIGVDIDAEILGACQKNLGRADLLERVDLIQGDVRDIDFLQNQKADTVIYDIPYWYPEKYSQYSSRKKEVKNPDLQKLVGTIRDFISHDIVIFAPPEMGYDFFKNAIGEHECVKVFINGKHDRNYIFLGELIQAAGETKIELSVH